MGAAKVLAPDKLKSGSQFAFVLPVTPQNNNTATFRFAKVQLFAVL